jgi:hypothetical protein
LAAKKVNIIKEGLLDHLNTLNFGIDSSSVIKRDGLVFPDIPIILGTSSSQILTSAD